MRLCHGRRGTVPAARTAAQNRRKHSPVPSLRPVFHVRAVSEQTSSHRAQGEGREGCRGGKGDAAGPAAGPTNTCAAGGPFTEAKRTPAARGRAARQTGGQ